VRGTCAALQGVIELTYEHVAVQYSLGMLFEQMKLPPAVAMTAQ
jgi:hypothetical protein